MWLNGSISMSMLLHQGATVKLVLDERGVQLALAVLLTRSPVMWTAMDFSF
jgi:hypothetical protein